MLRDMSTLQVLVALVGLGALIAWHEAGHFLAARLLGMRVRRFSVGFGPKLSLPQRGETAYSVGLIPFGGYVQIAGMTPFEPGALDDPRAYINQPRWARAVVIGAGPASNYVLAFVLFVLSLVVFPAGPAEVTAVEAGSPAAAHGLVPGARVYRGDGRAFASADDMSQRLAPSVDGALELTIEGRGALTIPLDEGQALGATFRFVPERQPALAIVGRAASVCVELSARTLGALAALVRGSDEVSVEGPLGIGRQITRAVRQGARELLWLLAYLSVTLGLMNLLPIPALDGIKLLILGTEGALRRDVSPALQVWVNGIGLILLLGLMAVMTAVDAFRMWSA